MKMILKIIGSFGLVLFSCVVLYFAFNLILSNITVEDKINEKKEIAIYILTNGVHTDIVVPTVNDIHDWSNEVTDYNRLRTPSRYKYLAIGWGDKGFYLNTPTWADLKFSVAFKAGFGLSDTAIHATYYQQMKENESCKKIMLSIAQYRRLVAYITSNFQKSNGQTIKINTDANYGTTDSFYEAIGRYSLFYTCNTWANEVLKSCGAKACYWTAFPKGIFSKY